jgi:hypothetical protein
MTPHPPKPTGSDDPAADIGPALHPVAPEQLGPVETGLPGLRSWGAVYAVVVGVFILWVTLLLLFMRAFS